jgi:hypothetical protein
MIGRAVQAPCPIGSSCADSSAADKASGETIVSVTILAGQTMEWGSGSATGQGSNTTVNMTLSDGSKWSFAFVWYPRTPSSGELNTRIPGYTGANN